MEAWRVTWRQFLMRLSRGTKMDGSWFLPSKFKTDKIKKIYKKDTSCGKTIQTKHIFLTNTFHRFYFYSDTLIIHKDRLEFRGVSLDSEGVYQCAAENKYGMIASATWVRVLGKFLYIFLGSICTSNWSVSHRSPLLGTCHRKWGIINWLIN